MSASDKSPQPPVETAPQRCSANSRWPGVAGRPPPGQVRFRAGAKAQTLQVMMGAAEGRQRLSVQHGIQLVSQGVKHGADVIQNVLGGGAGRALSLLSANALLCGP